MNGLDEWMDGWMDGWTGGWIGGPVNVPTSSILLASVSCTIIFKNCASSSPIIHGVNISWSS